MIYAPALVALFSILPALASPIQKRFDSVKIQSGATGSCLTTRPKDGPSDGTQLYLDDCNAGYISLWNISPGSGSVILANAGVPGKTFALDAGVPQSNNARAKIWTSYPGSTQQTWYLTADSRIAITGGNQCLDAETGTGLPQTYQCSTGNTNQVWNILGGGASPSSTSSVTPSSTSSSSSAPTSSPSSTTPVDQRIKFGNNQCLSIDTSGPLRDGIPVIFMDCPSTGRYGTSEFIIQNNGQISLYGTQYCLDAGSNPSDGNALKLWTCGGYPQQTWTLFSGTQVNGGLIQTANNQCVDVQRENPRVAQTWTCSGGDPQQQFTVKPFVQA